MRQSFLILVIVFITTNPIFSNQKELIVVKNKEINFLSFPLITNSKFVVPTDNLLKSNLTNLAASIGIDNSSMISIGMKLTSAGIANIIDGAIFIGLGYVFVWLMWTEIYTTTTFNSVTAWTISFYGPYEKDGGIYAGAANFCLIFGIISVGIGGLLLIPGIILWVVGVSQGIKVNNFKKQQKVVPVVSGNKIGVAIKF